MPKPLIPSIVSPERRDFLRVATAMTAAAGGGIAGLAALQGPVPAGPGPDTQDKQDAVAKPAPSGLGNDVPPAVSFHAGPGGTGSWVAQHGDTTTAPIAIEPWKGAKPSDEVLAFLPVHRLAALVQAKLVSPVELTELFLGRLKKYNPKLLFVVNFLEESARKEAKVAEAEIRAGKYRGPLHGIPYGIKDLFSAKGAPTTWGAKPFEDRVIDADATVVKKLRAAGAILIAKLASGCLALGDQWFRGRTNNPWNPERGSSGSSAGPGSATAAGCVPFAIGTETLGSIVSPSRRCGISALRPTFGRVSRAGCMALSHTMDKVGPMCRNALDCALVFAAIHGADPDDPSSLTAGFRFDPNIDLSKLRIGYDGRVDEGLLKVLRGLGAKPEKIGDRPASSRGGFGGRGRNRRLSRMRRVLTIESAVAFHDFLEQKLDEKMVVKRRVRGWRDALKTPAVDYLNAQRDRYKLMQEMAKFMEDWDLYVSSSGDLTLTNLTGHPSAVLPYAFREGQNRSGQPSRVQPQCTMIIGSLFADDQILSVAHAFQRKTDWHSRKPDLSGM